MTASGFRFVPDVLSFFLSSGAVIQRVASRGSAELWALFGFVCGCRSSGSRPVMGSILTRLAVISRELVQTMTALQTNILICLHVFRGWQTLHSCAASGSSRCVHPFSFPPSWFFPLLTLPASNSSTKLHPFSGNSSSLPRICLH